MNEQEFRQELKRGLSGIYFFFGEEEYLKKFYSGRALLQTVGDTDTAEWNSYFLEGKKNKKEPMDFASLEEALSAVPIMGEKVFVKYTVDFTVMSDEETDRFLGMLEAADTQMTVVVIIAAEDGFDPGKLPKSPSGLYKRMSAFCKMVNFCKMTNGELKKWINRRAAAEGMTIEPSAAESLIKRSGTTMFSLSGELSKLCAYAASNSMSSIDSNTVGIVCSSNEEEVAYAMANAILNGDRRGALKELHRCKTAREDPMVVMGMVSKSLCDMLTVCCLMDEGYDQKSIAAKMKMHEYRAGIMMNSVRNTKPEQLIATLGRCREADLAIKSMSLGYIALERFICTIPAGKRNRTISSGQ